MKLYFNHLKLIDIINFNNNQLKYKLYYLNILNKFIIKMELNSLSESELNEVYNWVDEIPLSRPKKNIARDFADACQTAEVYFL